MENIKLPADAKVELDRCGVSVAEWARKHSVSPTVVRGVLSGSLKGRRGQAHKVAVLLGIKDGLLVSEGHIA